MGESRSGSGQVQNTGTHLEEDGRVTERVRTGAEHWYHLEDDGRFTGRVRTCAEHLTSNGVRTPQLTTPRESLYRPRSPGRYND